MRIISGKAKGHTLIAPSTSSTRPVTDKVREASFSILESMTSGFINILDLFAGSGSMGLEALSRGAKHADFVDHDHRCCSAIRRNLVETGFMGQAHVYCCSVSKALSILKSSYDLIFFDPPYSYKNMSSLLSHVSDSHLVDSITTIVVSHSVNNILEESYDRFHKQKERCYGDTCISIYQEEDVS